MTSPSSQTFTTIVTDDSWMRGLHPGHLVQLVADGQIMIGKTLAAGPDHITITVPLDEQPDGLRCCNVTGTAVVSLDGAAARVPVSAQSVGESVRLQLIGPAEIIQRRRYVRVPLSVPVHLAWQGDQGGSWSGVESRTVDISVGGLRIASARAVWPDDGQTVQVSLALPDGTVVERATVIGKDCTDDLRLAFTGIGPAARMVIESLVQTGSTAVVLP